MHKDAAERGRGKAVAEVAEVEGVCAVVAGGWWLKCLTGPLVVLGAAAVEKSGGTQFTCFTCTKVRMLTHAFVRSRMLTYADGTAYVPLTYAHVCRAVDVCSRMHT